MPLCEAVEAWSFVDNKENTQWIWSAMNVINRQIIGVYIGDRNHACLKENCLFFTDFYKAYQNMIPLERHSPINKEFKSMVISYIERFNNTV